MTAAAPCPPADRVDPVQLPRPLVRLLTEEGHARLCLGLLRQAESEAEATDAALRRQVRPMDRLLAVARRPRPSVLALTRHQEDLSRVRRARLACETILRRLAAEIEVDLESVVRATVPKYVRGLAAMENLADWERALGRFVDRLGALRRAVGEARGAATAGYQKSLNRISDNAYDRLADAQQAADRLEEEIAFINRLSDLHRELVAATPCAGVFVPTVPVAPYANWIGQLPSLAIGPLQAEFTRILGVLDQLETEGAAVLADAVKRSRQAHLDMAHSFVLAELAALRSFADATWVNPRESDETIHRLERRYLKEPAIDFGFETDDGT